MPAQLEVVPAAHVVPPPNGDQMGAASSLPGAKGVPGGGMLALPPGAMQPTLSQQQRSSGRPSQMGALHGKDAKAHHSRKSYIKIALSHSAWYQSQLATDMRQILHGKSFAVMMTVALLLALFMPDLWVLCGVNNNVAIDLVLTVVMILFAIELVSLSIVDASYLLSFFQLMDVIGTVSMIFDISYMIGDDATLAKASSNDSDAKKNLMLLRAARAAKVGARAGRLSRVLRFLRFLPFLSGGNKHSEEKGIASMISGQLANLLATRVACLTIMLVIFIPMFDIWTFPQSDFSLRTWSERLSRNHEQGRTADVLSELRLMSTFYSDYDYGPYAACPGSIVDGPVGFQCTGGGLASPPDYATWQPTFSAPGRLSSALVVHTEKFMVAFNMHHTAQVESAFSMCTICFIIFIMVFSGLALSSVVTELAVRPLERMLDTVRQIASTVFKFSAEMEAEGEDEPTDIDSSNEMKLLEKVVQKLAIIADLQSAKNVPQHTEDMQDEDIGILSMMHGKNIVEEQQRQDRRSCAVPRKKVSTPAVRLEDFGMSAEVYNSWGFNPLPLTKTQRSALAHFTISRFHESDGFIHSTEDGLQLGRFIQAVEKDYLPVPFHSFAHAVDVLHGVSRLMRLTSSEAFLTELEQYSMLIAAIGHDIGHPGVNNGFLLEVGHELALQYNDKSPLENMHCAKLYTIMANQTTNIFNMLSKDQYTESRKHCIETILHTDMMVHQAMVKELQMLYQMNTEVFASRSEQQQSPGIGSNVAEIEIFSNADSKMLVMECFLHSADVSNPCRQWEVTHAWALLCLEEFFAQGDQEKMLGIPVQFLNDRDKLNKPNSQIGFIEFMIAPFFAAQVRLWPALQELGESCANNLARWEELWVKDTTPGEEEKAKVRNRVTKVANNMNDAVNRAAIHA